MPSGCSNASPKTQVKRTLRLFVAMVDLRPTIWAAAPYLVLTATNLTTAGFLALLHYVLTSSAGVSATVLVVYQQILSSLLLSSLSFIFHRRSRPTRTQGSKSGFSFQLLAWCCLIGLLQISMGEMLLTMSLHYVTPTFQSVALNTMPIVVFVLAVACGQESFQFCSIGGQAKMWGTLVSAVGATLVVRLTQQESAGFTAGGSNGSLGIAIVSIAILAESTAMLFVERVALKYQDDIKLSAMITVCGTIQVALVGAFMEREVSAWKLKLNLSGSLELLVILYGGILCNGLAHFGRTWSTHLKGPVFAAAFSPLLVVFSLLLQISIYGPTAQIESFIGSVLVIVGLYILLWAKAKDYKVEKANTNAETLPIEASTAEPLLRSNSSL